MKRFFVLALLLAVSGCTRALPTGARQPLFFPSRITVQDLVVDPGVGAAGQAVSIRFTLVRAGDDGAPIYWTSHFLETPDGGGTLSAASGGPIASGEPVEILYRPPAATRALITIFPASTEGAQTGDGTGDWRSFAIEVF